MKSIDGWLMSSLAAVLVAGAAGCFGAEEQGDAIVADEAEATTAASAALLNAAHSSPAGRPRASKPRIVKPPRPGHGPLCDGHGGRGGPGGAGGPDGGGGTGGSVPPPQMCMGVPPSTPLLTGAAATVAAPGVAYSYAAPNLVSPTVTPVFDAGGVWQSLTAVITPGTSTDPANNWLGFGVPLFGCVDASVYTGVRFTVSGDLGTCALSFVAVPNDKNADEFGGTCTLDSCYAPASAPFGLGTTTIHFADLAGGSPAGPVDSSRLMDIQWQLNVPTDGVTAPCVANLTIQDVAFVTD